MSKNVVFALTSGRSGTLSLCELLKKNAPNCQVAHEPYLHPGNASMFGLPIYDHATHNDEPIRRLLRKKAATIASYSPTSYVETSHAFLKSFWHLAPEFFPNMKVVHMFRNPVEVALSEANRENFIHKMHVPLRFYRGRDGKPYFRWALTGLEPIFGHFDLRKISQFQRYVLQWIEIENRAMAFLDRFDMHSRCMTLVSPYALNDPQTIPRVLDFLEFDAGKKKAILPGVQNRTPGNPTVVGEVEMRECRELIDQLPAQYLEIFRHAPYVDCNWAHLLHKSSAAALKMPAAALAC